MNMKKKISKKTWYIIDFVGYMFFDLLGIIISMYILFDFGVNFIEYDIHYLGDMMECSYFGGWGIVAFLLTIWLFSCSISEMFCEIFHFIKRMKRVKEERNELR